MEFEDILKFVWGAMILVIFVVSRLKGAKRGQQEVPPHDEFEGNESDDGEFQQESERGRAMPFDLEQLFREMQQQPSTPKSKPTSPAPKPVEVKPSSPIFEDEISEPKEQQKVEFDLRKAVIMTEILTPKFKNE